LMGSHSKRCSSTWSGLEAIAVHPLQPASPTALAHCILAVTGSITTIALQ
jgi:hypothetical protein